MRLVFLGPPGAGKGTQAVGLSEKVDICHISTGDILRRAIDLATPTGLEAKGYVEKGELVPFEIILRLVEDRLRDLDCSGGWILDGFPRNLDQARAFEELADRIGTQIDRVIYFRVGDDLVVRRLSGRRTCRDCGATFHVEFSPPAVAGICDKCGGKDLYQRADDVEAAIRNRLVVYESETDPLVDFYREQDRLIEVDGGAPVGEVKESLDRVVAGLSAAG